MAHGGVRHGQELVHSYLALRKAVGIIGMALPLVLLSAQRGDLDSVSQAYYTGSGGLFVAGLGAIGVFLLFYRGVDGRDRIASCFAGVSALVVGLVPCGCGSHGGSLPLWGWSPAYGNSVWPLVHLAAAAALFVVLALFCLWLFPMSDVPRRTNPKKDQRNAVYRAAGLVIVGCLLALLAHFAVVEWLPVGGVFWLETAMLVAFGLSWAVKGEAISFLNDRGSPGTLPGGGRNVIAEEVA